MSQATASVKRATAANRDPVRSAIETKGWLRSYRWLLLRRLSQFFFIALFWIGPITVWLTKQGYMSNPWWPVKGNLASSLTLDILPLTDPYQLLQSLAAWHAPHSTALIGASIVLVFYLLIGGRVYCSWVCPVNVVTDAAAWLRRKLGIKNSRAPAEGTRRWLLLGTFVVSAATGAIAWEWVNPVSMLQRGLVFGMGAVWGVVLAIFLYDLLVAARGWCGHLCPVGAFYSLLGKTALWRISADKRRACDDCMDCFAVCPEPQVIRPALKASGQDHPIIIASDCTTCGRCIDVCSQEVFRLTTRFNRSES